MQPTLPQSNAGTPSDMDNPAAQSMDWLFKKERIYLLAQFWQQRATLAEKEVNTLKEQLSSTSITPKSLLSGGMPDILGMQQNGLPSSPPLSLIENSINKINSKLLNNNKPDEINENKSSQHHHHHHQQHQKSHPQRTSTPSADDQHKSDSGVGNNNNNMAANNSASSAASSSSVICAIDDDDDDDNDHNRDDDMDDRDDDFSESGSNCNKNMGKASSPAAGGDESTTPATDILSSLAAVVAASTTTTTTSSSTTQSSATYNNNDNDKKINSDNSISSSNNNNNINNCNLNKDNNNSSTRTLAEDMVAKDKEISALVEEVSRLRGAIAALQESHHTQIKLLEERIDAKRHHITRLESKIDTETDYDDVKKENSILRSVDLSSPPNETKQFQELLLERTKALAAQTEALKSSNSDDGMHSSQHDIDKTSSHHDTSSRASTPVLETTAAHRGISSSIEDNLHINGLGINSMPLSMTKSPTEDNNNTLGPHIPHPGAAGLIPGLPFQFQERGHFRFADDLQMPPGSMVGRLGDSLIPKGDPMEARLQEMLRYNMDKYSNKSLDTLHISRRVRELLSVHNIGQRLFAKYVLGLSQGTVSELLSKPKPWDKLTEKGRDSYRKMHAWGCDDNAVMLLKSLIPKKDSGMAQYGRSDSEMTDERIQHILGEAASLMKPSPQSHQQQSQQQQQHQQQHAIQQSHNLQMKSLDDSLHSHEDSKSPLLSCTSPFSSKESHMRKIKKFDNDDISQDKVARIYQEELAKLMTRAPPNGGMPPTAQMPEENIRLALEAYHRELAKFQQSGAANMPNFPNFPNLPGLLALQQQALNGAQDLTIPKEKEMKMNGQQQQQSMPIKCENSKDGDDPSRHSGSAFSLVRPKAESTPTTTASSAPSPIGNNSILPPAITPTDEFSSAASPLQRMASITNSLITQPPVTPHHSTPQRPLKAVLPPITQQQFDMFNNLNTEDIVRRVKEALSQYSISQRLFGESVLGLSQGSVSDLLARPKPWHMLTQKGREPFIRMKMFLEDDNAVHKLVASQYKIAPEKLMRTGSYSGSPQIPSVLTKQMPMMPKMMSKLEMGETLSKMQHEQQQHMLQQLQQHQTSPMPHIPTSQPQTMLLTPPGLPPHHAIALNNSQEKKLNMPMPIHSPQQQQNNHMRNMSQHMSPTVYEMAALTQDLDTQVITTKIKEALLANNIGQKIFGEAVLGLSQGSVSELLSKPKPWHMLSIKGREPFIRMQLWLADTNNVERLQLLKNERREANKRRRSTGAGAQDNSSDTSSNDTSEFYHSNSPGPASVGSSTGPPNKKQRVLFSEEQKEALRLAFALDPYPNVATIEFLANELGLSTRTITNWFHNHRMRLKQQVPHGAPSEPVPSRDQQSGAPFDQNHFRALLHQRIMELQKERMGLSGVPMQYAPYFAANPNLAALISRGLIPGADAANFAALNNAFKEQMNGLDLSMGSLKRENDDDFDDLDGDGDGDGDNDVDHDRDHDADDHMSDNESIDGSENLKEQEAKSIMLAANASRSSRRKPAAPQWVNPDWQDDKLPPQVAGAKSGKDEVIINGVCVMQQAADYSRLGSEDTVHLEPTGGNRYDEDDRSDDEDRTHSEKLDKQHESLDDRPPSTKDADISAATPIKTEIDTESDRWEY